MNCCAIFVFIHIQHGASPLVMAAQNGHKDIIEMLMKSKVDVNTGDTKVSVKQLFSDLK